MAVRDHVDCFWRKSQTQPGHRHAHGQAKEQSILGYRHSLYVQGLSSYVCAHIYPHTCVCVAPVCSPQFLCAEEAGGCPSVCLGKCVGENPCIRITHD